MKEIKGSQAQLELFEFYGEEKERERERAKKTCEVLLLFCYYFMSCQMFCSSIFFFFIYLVSVKLYRESGQDNVRHGIIHCGLVSSLGINV